MATFRISLAFFFLASFRAQAAYVSFVNTNSVGQADTNYFKAIPVSGPVANADGSFTTIGLPIRITPDANGKATNLLQQNNYQITNAFLGSGYYIRVPLDSGPTVYPSGQLLISGGNVFVTVMVTNGGTNGTITFNQVTNALGFAPLERAATNGYTTLTTTNPAAVLYTNSLPGLTNGFVDKSITNNAATVALLNSASNSLQGQIVSGAVSASTVTNIAKTMTNGITTLATTNANQVLYTNALPALTNGYVDKSITNNAVTVGLLNSASNSLQGQIVSGAVSASTVTNIAKTMTNGMTTLATTNANQVLYTNALPALTNGFVDKTITNGFAGTNYAKSVTNGMTSLATTNADQVLFTNALPALTNGFVSTNDLYNATNGIVAGIASKVDSSSGSSTAQTLTSPIFAGTSKGQIKMTGTSRYTLFDTNSINFYESSSAVRGSYLTTNELGIYVNNGTDIAKYRYNVAFLLDAAGDQLTLKPLSLHLADINNGDVMVTTGGSQIMRLAITNGAPNNNIAMLQGGSLMLSNWGGVGSASVLTTNFLKVDSIIGNATNQFTTPVQATNIAAVVTNGYSPLVFTNVAQVLYTNALPGLTNGFITLADASVAGTNVIGLSSGLSAFVATNRFVSTNQLISATNAMIAATNGAGLNTVLQLPTLIFDHAAWGYSNTISGSGYGAAVLSGLSNAIANNGGAVIAGGGYNSIGSATLNYSGISSGVSNVISGSGSAVIAGGSQNTIQLGADYSVIAGGQGNFIDGKPIIGLQWSTILGGRWNTITPNGNSQSGALILGGQSNAVAGSWSAALGRNVGISNNAVFAWSDGKPLASTTNSQVIFYATNGFGINTNSAGGNGLRVGGTVDAMGFTVQGLPISINLPTVQTTNLVIGAATNIFLSTNVLKFINAGSGIVTNGAYEWITAQGLYTNRSTGCIYTNNGSAWLLRTNGVTLYSLSGSSPIGTLTAISGDSPAPTSAYGFYFVHDGMIDAGLISSTNLEARLLSVSNALVTAGITTTNSNPGYGYTNASPMFFVVTDAGDANANGIYIQNAVASQWTNSTIAGYLLSSNGTSPRWSFTNGSAAEAYHKTLAAIPNGQAQFTTDGGGTAPGPTVWRGVTAYPTNSFTQVASTLPIYTPLNSNNITGSASVEVGGSDIYGRPGFYPFASLNPLIQPLTSYSQSPTIFTNCSTIYVGAGSFTASNSVTSGPNGLSIIGKGRSSTFITGQSVVSGNSSLQLQLGNSNYLKGLTFTGILFYNNGGGSGVGCTNWTIEDTDIIGDLDGIYITGTVGLYGLNLNHSRITSWWDCLYNVQTAVIRNSDLSSIWIGTNSLSGRNTNTAPQSPFAGLSCVRMEAVSSNCNYTISGGSMTISNGPTVGYASATNACIKIFDTNATLNIFGTTLIHSSTNVSYAIDNPGASTNLNGWYVDISNSVVTLMFLTNGISYPSTLKGVTPTAIAQTSLPFSITNNTGSRAQWQCVYYGTRLVRSNGTYGELPFSTTKTNTFISELIATNVVFDIRDIAGDGGVLTNRWVAQ